MKVYTEAEVLQALMAWAAQRDDLRAMIMTSTRAAPQAKVDRFSDYDIILFVKDIHPFHMDRNWLAAFGDVLVAYWDQVYHDEESGYEQFGNVVQFADGLKIDFTICPTATLRHIANQAKLPAEYDAGYRILLDKDKLTEGLPTPTHKAYIPERPSQELYLTQINDFFSDVPYVAKCLWRDELFPAKWCLDYDMKHVYLRQMLEWRAEQDHDWSVAIGSLGKGVKRLLPSDIWSEVEQSFAGADPEANWESLDNTVEVFRRVAVEVGYYHGYRYPHELHERVMAFVAEMKRQPHA